MVEVQLGIRMKKKVAGEKRGGGGLGISGILKRE